MYLEKKISKDRRGNEGGFTMFLEWIYSTARTSCRNFSFALASLKRFSRRRKSAKQQVYCHGDMFSTETFFRSLLTQ